MRLHLVCCYWVCTVALREINKRNFEGQKRGSAEGQSFEFQRASQGLLHGNCSLKKSLMVSKSKHLLCVTEDSVLDASQQPLLLDVLFCECSSST